MWGFCMTKIEQENLSLMVKSVNYKKASGRKILNKAFWADSKLFKTLLGVRNKNGIDYFNYFGKRYEFKRLTDTSLITGSVKENILKRDFNSETLPRILRLATCNKLNDSKLLVCYDNDIHMLVSFNYEGITYVIDYFNDLIMKKDDYFNICKNNILNEVSFRQLYELYVFIKEHGIPLPFTYFMLFPEELITRFYRMNLGIYGDYSKSGINIGNYALIGDNCDDIFLHKDDVVKHDILDEIEEYTVNGIETEHIKCLGDNHSYKDENHEFTFMLFSDIATDQEFINTLRSEDRYGKCHSGSWAHVMSVMKAYSDGLVSIIGGKYLINDVDYYYHTWIELELEDRFFVFDYTKNLIMDRDRYYELTGAKVINVVSPDEVRKIIHHVRLGNLRMNIMDCSYFSKEILSDLERNKHILKR